jgi:signal peptidase II
MTGPHRPSADPSADAEATEQFAAVPAEQFDGVPTEQFAALTPERFAETSPEPVDEQPVDEEPIDSIAGEAPRPPRRVLLLAAVALLGWALDLGTKVIAVRELEGRPPVTVIENVLYVQLVRNAGAAFALATGMTWLLTLIALGVVVAIFRVAGRLRSTGWAVALGLVLAGALGNLTDRLFRSPGPLHGRVVDFISVLEPDGLAWPVFNVADSAICTGGALLVLLALLGRELDGTRSRDHRDEPDA